MNHANAPRRRIRSFVHRARRLANTQQQDYAELWDRFGSSVPVTGFDPAALFEKPNPLTLEIGFGHAEVLLHEAQSCPDHNVLGMEVYRPALLRALREAQRRELTNLRVLHGDAAVLLGRFPQHCLHGIRLLFPDPWPKRRHWKRRLIQDRFIHDCARIVRPKGSLHLATDWEDYASHIQDVLERAPEWNVTQERLERPETHFERRGRRLGHATWEWVARHEPRI